MKRNLTPDVFERAVAHYMRNVEFGINPMNGNATIYYVGENYPVGYYVAEGEYAGALVDTTGDRDEIICMFQ